MDILADATKCLAVLINCRTDKEYKNTLLCGVAVFRGGLSGLIEVSDGTHRFVINVPESVQSVATYQVLADSKDNLEISYNASSN